MARDGAASRGAAARHGGLAWVTHRCPSGFVRTRDPEGNRLVTALLCTDQALSAETIRRSFRHRWPRETTGEESRAPLGVETQRPWPALASERTTPLVLGLDRLITRAGVPVEPQTPLPVEHAAWDRQMHATVHEVLACLRRQIWLAQRHPTSPAALAVGWLAHPDLERLRSAAGVSLEMDKVKLRRMLSAGKRMKRSKGRWSTWLRRPLRSL